LILLFLGSQICGILEHLGGDHRQAVAGCKQYFRKQEQLEECVTFSGKRKKGEMITKNDNKKG
jgi:hypothetical protein